MNFNTLNESFDKLSEKLLNEGPGAGYEITFKTNPYRNQISNIKIENLSWAENKRDVEVWFNCDFQTEADIRVESYYYGHEEKDVKVEAHQGFMFIDNDYLVNTEGIEITLGDDIPEMDREKLAEIVRDEVDAHTFVDGGYVYGGGWSHSVYDGSLSDADRPAEDNAYGDIYFSDLRIVDEGIIDTFELYASGEFEEDEYIDGKHIIQVSIDAYVENDYDESDLINWTYDVLTRNGYYVYGVDIIESWTNDEYNRKTGLSLADDDKHIILLSFDIEVEDEYYERDIVGCVEQELGLDILGSDVTATWKNEEDYNNNIQESLQESKNSEPYVLEYNDFYKVWEGTPKSNYDAYIRDARKVRRFDNFDSLQSIKDCLVKWCGYDEDDIIVKGQLQESEIGATAYASYNGPDVYGDGYAVFGYYDENCRALADSNWCSNWEEVQDLVHSYISKGDVVRIINNETGNDIIVTPDEYFDNFEGDFPIAPQDVEEGHMWNRTAKLDSFDLGLDESLLNEVKGVEYVDSYTIHGIKGELNMSNVDRFTINDIGKYEIINPYLDPRVDDYTAWEYQIELKKVFTADITIMAEEHMQGIDFESHFNNVPVKIDKCCTWIDDEYCDKEDIEYALNQFALNDIIFNIKFPPVSYIESGKFNGNFGEFGCRTSDFRCMGMSIVDDNIIEEINNNLLIKEGLDFYDDSNFNESSLDESIFDEKDYEFEEYEMLDANGDLLMIGRDDYMTDDEAIKYAREHKSPYLQKVKYKASFGSIDYANGLGTIILYDDEIEESINGVKDNGKKPVTEALFDYRTTKDVYGYSANDILQMTEKVLGLSQKEAVKYLNSHSEEDVQAIIDEATKHLYKNAGEKDKYWYFTRHGQGPGTFPRNATLLDWVEDDDFNTWIALDRMLTDEEMAEFELREQTPPDLEEGVLGTALKVAGAVGSVGSAIADAVGSLKEDSEIKPRRKFMGKKSVIKR